MSKGIDALVAERVMGWPNIGPDDPYRLYVDRGGVIVNGSPQKFTIGIIPSSWSPSTNISDAWEVGEKVVTGRHVRCSVTFGSHMIPNAEFFDVATGQQRFQASAQTTPLAICLAALRADGCTEAEIEEASKR